MNNIRVTYSGLFAFAIRLFSIITGTIFTLIITRQLSPEEFGTWGVINGIIIYALVINPIINYWVTREIARGEKTGSTAMISTGMFSIAGIFIYVLAAYAVGITSDAELDVLLFATFLIPIIFVYNSLSAINIGFKPQARSYALFIFEIIKIPLGLMFIYYFDMDVRGAILATLLAYFVSTIFLIFSARKQLQTKFQKKSLVKWIKMFWLPTYRTLPSSLAMSDVTVFTIITGSVVGVAYYTAAKTIGMLVNHVRAFSIGLYPKLLESEKQEFLQENLIKLFYFAFPLTAFAIVFAKPGLFILNPIYVVGASFVIFISLRMFLKTLNQVLFEAMIGLEKIDKNQNANFKDYVKSKLVWIPTFDLVRHASYIGILAILLLLVKSATDSMLDLVLIWSIIGFVVEIPLTIYIIYLTKKSFTLNIDKASILKYLFVTIAVFGSMGMIMENNLIYKESIFEFLPNLLIYVSVSIITYLAITFFIDIKTKILFKAIWKEIRK